MGGLKLFLIAAFVAAGASAASSQCRLCARPTTTLSDAGGNDGMQLEIETSLNFDRLILTGEGPGAAVVRPDGSSTSEGALTHVSPRAMVGSAVVHGNPGRAVKVELPSEIDLYSAGGGRIIVDKLITDLPSLARLDSAGNLTFRFGGRVTVTGDAEGDYRGSMPITVEYQ